MPDSPNKLSQFWQELKRRKVVRVITVYAAVAFIILQLIEILAPSLRLPEWTMNLILVMLIVGFIIAIILSWIYDVNPESGIVKTESANKAMQDEKPPTSSSWKIASYISFGVIIVLIIFNVIPRTSMFNNRGGPDRSIAVIPFRNDSPEEEKMGFINGTMEQILDNLSKIEYLDVRSRTSVEQYRDNTKTSSVIANEMDVGYLLEGSGQRDGNRVRITVQLIDARKDIHLWSNTYNEDIENVFDLQSEVARLVARDLEAVISAEANPNSDELTTERQIARAFYQRGLMDVSLYWENNKAQEYLESAEVLFHFSLEYDSTFIESYQQLANLYYEKYANQYSEWEAALDSAIAKADKALQMGSQDPDTHYVKGRIYLVWGQVEKAREAFGKALLFDPYNARSTVGLADTYLDTDVIKCLELYFEALEHGPPSTRIYWKTHTLLMNHGFKELSRHYLEERLKLNIDTLLYYWHQARIELTYGDFQAAREVSLKALAMDSLANNQLEFMALAYMFDHKYDSSLVYYRKNESLGRGIMYPRRMGYVLVQNGEVTEGERYIDENIVSELEELNREQVSTSVYRHLIELNAYRGEKEKALEHFRTLTKQDGTDFYDLNFLRSPLLDNIRDDPEFKEIEAELESIVQAKHDLIKQWLEENDLL